MMTLKEFEAKRKKLKGTRWECVVNCYGGRYPYYKGDFVVIAKIETEVWHDVMLLNEEADDDMPSEQFLLCFRPTGEKGQPNRMHKGERVIVEISSFNNTLDWTITDEFYPMVDTTENRARLIKDYHIRANEEILNSFLSGMSDEIHVTDKGGVTLFFTIYTPEKLAKRTLKDVKKIMGKQDVFECLEDVE